MNFAELKKKTNIPVLIHLSGALALFVSLMPFLVGGFFWVLSREENDEKIQSEASKLLDIHCYALAANLLIVAPMSFWLSSSEPAFLIASFIIPLLASLWSLWQTLRASKGEETIDALRNLSPLRALGSLLEGHDAELRHSPSKGTEGEIAVDLEAHLQDTKNPGGITYVRNQ